MQHKYCIYSTMNVEKDMKNSYDFQSHCQWRHHSIHSQCGISPPVPFHDQKQGVNMHHFVCDHQNHALFLNFIFNLDFCMSSVCLVNSPHQYISYWCMQVRQLQSQIPVRLKPDDLSDYSVPKPSKSMHECIINVIF